MLARHTPHTIARTYENAERRQSARRRHAEDRYERFVLFTYTIGVCAQH